MHRLNLLLSSTLSIINLAAASAGSPNPEILQRNAPLEPLGILKNEEGFGSEPVLRESELAAWIPDSQRLEKNATTDIIQDRSLELTQRQSCDSGYWYCSSFGRCCPQSKLCCSYGYCMDPENRCCPGGSCAPGFLCCSSGTCSPIGGECCSDGNYCEPGNVCVKLYDSGRIVCCTDLRCTAAVVSGITSYVTTTTRAQQPPVVTPPPRTTDVVVDSYETWYYTVTWWYLSYYWSTYQAQSEVTYTTIYSTTIYTTLATDSYDASSRFAALSRSLTFEAPASATSLQSLYGAETTGISGPTFAVALGTSTLPTSRATTLGNLGPQSGGGGVGGASAGSALIVGWSFIACAIMSGALMLVL